MRARDARATQEGRNLTKIEEKKRARSSGDGQKKKKKGGRSDRRVVEGRKLRAGDFSRASTAFLYLRTPFTTPSLLRLLEWDSFTGSSNLVFTISQKHIPLHSLCHHCHH